MTLPAEPTSAPVASIPNRAPEPTDVELPMQPLSVTFHRFLAVGIPPVPAGITPELIAYHHPNHPISLQYQAVRAEIGKQFSEPASRACLLTAGLSSSGLTTVVLNLAATLAAESDHRVLVIDLNAEEPSAARKLGAQETPGLAEVLALTTPLAWAIQPTAVPNLHVLAAGAGLIPSDELPRLLTQIRGWFDWILLDGGVFAPDAPCTALLESLDAAYLVTRQQDLEREEFLSLRGTLRERGAMPGGYITTCI
jgi:Mrp family chromosome partitioning ATPase